MTHIPRLSLAAPPCHPLAEGVRLAFELRGTDLAPVAALDETDFRLSLRRGAEAPIILRDARVMFDLSEDLHPDHPLHPRDPLRRAEHRQAIAQLPTLARLLDELVRTTDPRDVDLNTHLLRVQIAALAGSLARPANADRAYSLLELAAVPLLWRIDALDRTFETHLLAGHDRLRNRQDWLVGTKPVTDVLSGRVLGDWLQTVVAAEGLVSRKDAATDWSTALGPSGRPSRRENGVPLDTPKTKVHSIGTDGRIR
jgi:hypothetical protein